MHTLCRNCSEPITELVTVPGDTSICRPCKRKYERDYYVVKGKRKGATPMVTHDSTLPFDRWLAATSIQLVSALNDCRGRSELKPQRAVRDIEVNRLVTVLRNRLSDCSDLSITWNPANTAPC